MAALRKAVVWSFQQNIALFLLVAGFLVITRLVAAPYGVVINFGLYHGTWWKANGLIVLPILLLLTLWSLARARPDSPFQYLADLYVNRWQLQRRLVLGLPAIIILTPMFGAFSSIKHAIKLFNPNLIDGALIDLDQALHGTNAWELLQPMLGFPAVTQALDFLYIIWFLVLFAIVTLVAGWLERPQLRNQYLISFALCWILLGSFFAVLGASVGPVYLATFLPGEAGGFEGLIAYLRSVGPLMAIDAQDLLLKHYSEADPGLGRGISAMPSVHVAIAMLQALLGWKVGRLAGVIATFYLAAILLGSVHLGWHYAVDGYASIIAAYLIWISVGWFTRPARKTLATVQPAE